MEIWKDIEEFEGVYQVSNLGNIKSLRNGRILRSRNRDFYRAVNLYNNGTYKTLNIHRLVAQAFIPNPNNLPIVNHIDENKVNNNAENLEWCTVKHNNDHSRGKKVMSIIDKNTGKTVQKIDLTNFEVKIEYIK